MLGRDAGFTIANGVSAGIAVLALLFTVSSFWWLHARRGRLRVVGQPRSFAVSTSGKRLHLNVPLSFFNSGPTPAWAVHLELRFNAPGLPSRVPFVATRPGVQPLGKDDRPLATQVALTGRESRVICCEFIEQSKAPDTMLSEGTLRATVVAREIRTWGKERERALGDVLLHITDGVVKNQGNYIAHDNYVGAIPAP